MIRDAYTMDLGRWFVGRVELSEARPPRGWGARSASLRDTAHAPPYKFTRRDSLRQELLERVSTEVGEETSVLRNLLPTITILFDE